MSTLSEFNYAMRNWNELHQRIHSFNQPIHTTFTFKQINTKDQARVTLASFSHTLSKCVYKNAYRRHGKKIRLFGALEGYESYGTRFHWHTIIESPHKMSPISFSSLTRKTWETKRLSGDLNEVGILESKSDVENWLDYTLKTYTKEDYLDSFFYDFL